MSIENENYDYKLPEKSVKELQRLGKAIPATRKQLEVLKSTGLDVSSLEDKLKWAEETSKILLKSFS